MKRTQYLEGIFTCIRSEGLFNDRKIGTANYQTCWRISPRKTSWVSGKP